MLKAIAVLSLSVMALFLACSKPTRQVELPVECDFVSDWWPSWSPDGRYIAYHKHAIDNATLERCGSYSIWMYDSQTGKFGFFVGPGMFPKWNPQGTILAFNWAKIIYFYYPDLRYVRRVTGIGDIYAFNWSPSGDELIFNGEYGGSYGCVVIDTLGNRLRDILPDNYRVAGLPVWSNNGDQLLLSVSDSLTNSSIILVDTLGNLIREVSPFQGFDWGSELDWSLDENLFVTFITNYDEQDPNALDLRIYDMQGQLQNSLGSGAMARWSPDDSRLVFHRTTAIIPRDDRDNPGCYRYSIWTCDADGSNQQELLGWPQVGYDSTMFGGGYNWLNPPPPQ